MGSLNALALITLFLFIGIYWPTFSITTYERHYTAHNTAQLIDVPQGELIAVTHRLMGYMAGRYDDLLIYANVAGEYRQFFNQREIDHMADVRDLFLIGFTIRNVAILIFIATAIYAFVINKSAKKVLAKCYFAASFSVLAMVGLLLLLIFSDFHRYFIIFHEIFFFNDYWQLNPATSLLINMVPLVFFTNIFTVAMAIFLACTLVMCVVSGTLLFRNRTRNNH